MGWARRRCSRGRGAGRSTRTRRPPRRRSDRVSVRAGPSATSRNLVSAWEAGQLVEHPQEILGEKRALSRYGGPAGLEYESAADRPVGVLKRVGGVQVVVEPRDVEEVALRGTGRVVRDRVESAVQLGEPEPQPGGALAQRVRRLRDVRDRRRDLPGERPDLVLDRAGRLLEERTERTERRAQGLRAGQELLPRLRRLDAELVGEGEGGLGLLQGARQLTQGATGRP